MDNLFLVLFLVSFGALVIGMIKPDWVLKFMDEGKRDRKRVLLVFGSTMVISFVLFGITVPDVAEKEEGKVIVNDIQKNNQEEKENLYASEMLMNSLGWSKTFTTLGELFSNPKIGTNDWTIKVASEIQIMKTLTKEAEGIVPTERYKEAHDIYLKGVKEFMWVALNLPKAIDDMDSNLMNRISDRMIIGSEYVQEATDKILEINNKKQ